MDLDQLRIPATHENVADAILDAPRGLISDTLRKLAFERDLLREALRNIAGHSVCCDARHIADRALAGFPIEDAEACDDT